MLISLICPGEECWERTGGLGLEVPVESLLGIHAGLQTWEPAIVSHGSAQYWHDGALVRIGTGSL